MSKADKSDEQWKQELSPEQYYVLRQKGTERPFSGAYNKVSGQGVFKCAGCGTPLFETAAKYDSGSGWPSFFQPASPGAVAEHTDHSHGMVRTEVTCATCGGHLGHLFPDGPRPTGQRYCINSLSLDFDRKPEK